MLGVVSEGEDKADGSGGGGGARLDLDRFVDCVSSSQSD